MDKDRFDSGFHTFELIIFVWVVAFVVSQFPEFPWYLIALGFTAGLAFSEARYQTKQANKEITK